MGSSTPQYAPNHVLNPQTGFVENKAYPYAFDSDKKLSFLKLYEANSLSFYETCEQMGVRYETVNKHYHSDPAFKKAFDELELIYLHKLQAVGRKNALNPRSVVERIWVQKSHSHVPGFEKYSEQKNLGSVSVTLNVDAEFIEMVKKRSEILDGELVNDNFVGTHEQELKTLDSHSDRVPVIDEKSEK